MVKMTYKFFRTPPLLLGLLVISLLIPVSCVNSDSLKPTLSEGTIHYKISYPPEIKRQSIAFLLPRKMDFYFKPGIVRASFKGSLSLYDLDFISDHQKDSSITLLKVLDNKLYVPASETKKLFIFKNQESARVTLEKDTTRTIQGYKVHRATISDPTTNALPSYEVWYAPQIWMETLNKNTPFSNIPGALLEFNLSFNNILFQLKAEGIDSLPPPPSVFTVPPNYKVTTIEEIETMISGILK